ncbi:hypothetical protein [Burkholderia orbicola]|uniref:hypothetical protein n=1 Tax=Burkholderia orbicola TaxID=2978683 RepID=UPI00264E2FB7|nr:hypothetical protein [Burkholderia orbicola]MDN7559108.1 hypothetical protein [Burkholderia orbicola]
MVEHTAIPDEVLVNNTTLREIVFMGTGAASYIDMELAERAGISVSTVSEYARPCGGGTCHCTDVRRRSADG